MSEVHGAILLVAALLVAVACLGLSLQGRGRAGLTTWIGVLGVVLSFATVASARRLEATAQAWIVLTIAIFALELAVLRAILRSGARAEDVAPQRLDEEQSAATNEREPASDA